MNFITYLVSLGLIAAACSSPIKCPADCEETEHIQLPAFRHVPDLENSSVAPWKVEMEEELGREPPTIRRAVCQGDCKIERMKSRPIFLEISVYKVLRNGTSPIWCKCPYMLAVGCTCIDNPTPTQ